LTPPFSDKTNPQCEKKKFAKKVTANFNKKFSSKNWSFPEHNGSKINYKLAILLKKIEN
jgi:hypothetical protein